MQVARSDQPLGHRDQECTGPTGWLDSRQIPKIAVDGKTGEIENQLDDPTASEDLTVLVGLVDPIHLSVYPQPQIEAQLFVCTSAAPDHCFSKPSRRRTSVGR